MSTMIKCPSCGKEYEKLLRGGICPNFECRAPLKLVEREDEFGNLVKTAEFRKQKETFKEEDLEVFNVIYDRDSVKVEKSNRNNYIVTFTRVMHFNWIYCPNCESKMFQNNMVKGSFEHKCHKCKSVTTYVFVS